VAFVPSIVGERYTAKRAGRARIACGGDVSDVEASEPTRLALLVGQDQDRYYLSVHAYDQNGLARARRRLGRALGAVARTASDAASSTQERVVRRISDGDHRITVRFQQLEQTIDLDHPRPAH